MGIVFLYGLIQLKISFLPIFLAVLLSWPAIQKTMAFNLFAKDQTDEGLKIMSFNAKSFGRYSPDSVKQQHIDMILKEQPDLLCLQEFYMHEKGRKKFLNNIQETLGLEHRYLKPSDYTEKGRFYGIALLSNYPVINQGYLDFEDHKANGVIYADLKIGADTIRVVNAHLQSVKLIDQPMGNQQNELKALFTTGFITKMNRVRTGFIKRAKQVKEIEAIVEKSPHKVIFCGDFNDTPLSYSYKQMTQTLKDGFLHGGLGFGSTYAGPLPLLRIDYILLNQAFEVREFQVLDQQLSDHHPIICRISLP